MNIHQLTLDLLTEPAERPPSTNGTGPTAARELDLEALEDLDLDHHDEMLEAELADALADGCQGPRTCTCPHPVGDCDELGDLRCIFCGHGPP